MFPKMGVRKSFNLPAPSVVVVSHHSGERVKSFEMRKGLFFLFPASLLAVTMRRVLKYSLTDNLKSKHEPWWRWWPAGWKR